MPRSTRLLAPAALALLLAGCGGGGGDGGTRPPSSLAITSFGPTADLVASGAPAQLVAVFSGGTASVDHGVGAVTSGVPVATGPLTADTTFALLLTGADGATARTSATVRVVAPPIAAGLVAAQGRVTAGQQASLTPTFSGGTGAIDHGVGQVLSGVPVQTGALFADTNFTLTVTNAVGVTATTEVQVTVAPPTGLAALAAGQATVTLGRPTTLTPTFGEGSGVISNDADGTSWAVASGTPVAVTPGRLGATTYTLTVTGPGGAVATASRTVTAVVAPAITSFSTAAAAVTTGGATTLTAVFSGGSGVIGGGVGAVASGVATSTGPLAVATVFTLTVTNAAGDAVTALRLVDVVPAPVATALVAGASLVTQGEAVTLTPSFSGGTGTIHSDAEGWTAQATSGIGLTIRPGASSTYTLTVTNAAGATASTQAPVAVVAPPAILGFQVSPGVLSSGAAASATFTLASTGGVGTASVEAPKCVPDAAGAAFSLPLNGAKPPDDLPVVAAQTTCSYTVTVANAAGSTVNATVSAVIEPAPAIVAFGFQPKGFPDVAVAPGEPLAIDWAFDAVSPATTATLDGAPVASAGTLKVDGLQASRSYQLVVRNGAGDTVAQTITASVLPVVDLFAVGPSRAAASGTAVLSPFGATGVFADFRGSAAASASVTCAGAACPFASTTILPGGAFTFQAGAATGTAALTLTVTGTSGDVAGGSATVTVVPTPSISAFVAGSTVIPTGGSTTLVATYTGGTATIAASDGTSWAVPSSGSAIPVRPGATTTYTLTVRSPAGATAAAQVTVTVVPGSWSAFNTLLSPTLPGATVTAIPGTNKVLVAGGAISLVAPTTGTSTVLVCDVSGACSPPAGAGKSMSAPRVFHTATPITAGPRAGQIALVGGYSAATSTATAIDLYDPVTDSLVATSGTPYGMARHAAVLLGDGQTLLLAGGETGPNAPTSSFVRANLATGARPLGSMSLPRADLTATMLGSATSSLVALIGGTTSTAAIELFDQASGAVIGTRTLPGSADVRAHSATWLPSAGPSGKVLVAGGLHGVAGTPSTALYLIDAGTLTASTSTAALGVARSRHASLRLASGDVLLCGGKDAAGQALAACERYSPAGDRITPTGSMLAPRADFGLAAFAIAGLEEILAAGGAATSTTPFAELYSPF